MQSAFYPQAALFSFHRSAVCSLQLRVSVFYAISVFVRSIKELNLNLIKIEACEAGSRTQLSFLLLAASQQRSDRSNEISWLIANRKEATLRLQFVNNDTTPNFLWCTLLIKFRSLKFFLFREN